MVELVANKTTTVIITTHYIDETKQATTVSEYLIILHLLIVKIMLTFFQNPISKFDGRLD